jgi:hypothetical protein
MTALGAVRASARSRSWRPFRRAENKKGRPLPAAIEDQRALGTPAKHFQSISFQLAQIFLSSVFISGSNGPL